MLECISSHSPCLLFHFAPPPVFASPRVAGDLVKSFLVAFPGRPQLASATLVSIRYCQ